MLPSWQLEMGAGGNLLEKLTPSPRRPTQSRTFYVQVRVKLDALQEAFHRRSVERRAAHSAHQTGTGAFALQVLNLQA